MFRRFTGRLDAQHALLQLVRYEINDTISSAREDTLLLNGQAAAMSLPSRVDELRDAQFKVFSQNGEDGIIQYLVKAVKPAARTFVEFGVQNYLESNTRFLMMHNGWRGLVLDGEQAYIDFIRGSKWYGWKYPLRAECAFVTAENINELIRSNGFSGDIGLLSIDLDGVDYHVWKAIDVVRPAIVVIEYNRAFPVERLITVPYSENFDRTAAHSSGAYCGCSLSAAVHLGKKKGYRFVGVEDFNTNAFFVREELAGTLPTATVRADYGAPVPDAKLCGLPVLNVVSGEIEHLE
jgi:hypothetical protein